MDAVFNLGEVQIASFTGCGKAGERYMDVFRFFFPWWVLHLEVIVQYSFSIDTFSSLTVLWLFFPKSFITQRDSRVVHHRHAI